MAKGGKKVEKVEGEKKEREGEIGIREEGRKEGWERREGKERKKWERRKRSWKVKGNKGRGKIDGYLSFFPSPPPFRRFFRLFVIS